MTLTFDLLTWTVVTHSELCDELLYCFKIPGLSVLKLSLMTSPIVAIDNTLAVTAQASGHVVLRGSEITAYLEFPTPLCLYTMQPLWGYDDD